MMQNSLSFPKRWFNVSIFFPIWVLGLVVLSMIAWYMTFLKPSQAALPFKMEAKVVGSERAVNIFPIDKGRVRISVEDFFKEELCLAFDFCKEARFLVVRKGFDIRGAKAVSDLRVSVLGGESIDVKGDAFSYTPRSFIPLPKDEGPVIVKIESLDPSAAKLIIDEICLVRDRPTSKSKEKLSKKFLFGALALIACIGTLGYLSLGKRREAIYGSIYFFVLPIAIHFCLLSFAFSPERTRDLRLHFASGSLQEFPGSNLNYGLHMASNVLQGKGPLINNMPPWCRMPGYGCILALSGSGADLLQMSMNSVSLQIILFGMSLSFFFWSALRIMSPFAASVSSSAVSILPFNFSYIQIESLMPAVVLFCCAATCLFIEKYQSQKTAQKLVGIPLKYHLLLHFSFALWFFLRTDILPAWALLSLVLYVKNLQTWKFFLIPLGFMLTIGLSWAFFKLPFTGEFSMTTNSIGASLMGGLWEIPHKFIWLPEDGSYFSWMAGIGQDPTTKKGSDVAVQEVLRFSLTYPIYIVTLMWHKFLLFACTFSWCRLWLLFVIFSSFFIKYKRFQTLLLGWIALFNVPVFFVFYASGGRFYQAPTICFFVAALPLLLDKEYYQKIYAHKIRFVFALLIVFAITRFGFSLDELLIRSDAVRYWSPFLDPALSSLNVVKGSDV